MFIFIDKAIILNWPQGKKILTFRSVYPFIRMSKDVTFPWYMFLTGTSDIDYNSKAE